MVNENKLAIVTGGGSGIGFAIAHRFLQEEAKVIINGRSKEGVDIAVKELQSKIKNANVSGIAADFSKVEEVNNLLSELPEIDILINNAGIFEPKPFADIPDEEKWQLQNTLIRRDISPKLRPYLGKGIG